MSDFKSFQRENARREAEQKRAEAEERNADIERDAAYERAHKIGGRKGYGFWGGKRKRGTTPIWRLTAGTWAQLILALLWMAVLAVSLGLFSGPQTDAKGWLSAVVFVAGAILGPVTWRVIGPRAREVLRTGIRFGAVAAAVVIACIAVWRSARDKDDDPDGARASTAHALPSTPRTPAPAAPAPPLAPPLAPPPASPLAEPTAHGAVDAASDAKALEAALRAEDAALAWRALDAIARSHDDARQTYERARRAPTQERALAGAIARLDALAPLEGALRAFTLAHADELPARAAKEKGAQLALRFAAPTRAHADALVKAALQTRSDSDTTALDSLTILLARGAPMPLHPDLTPIHAAWFKARASATPKERDAACRALGEHMVSGSGSERALAADALRDLAPRCTVAGPVILKRLLAQATAAARTPMTPDDEAHWTWAFHAVGRTGIEHAGAMLRFVDEVTRVGGLRGRASLDTVLDTVLDTMFDHHLLATAGVTRAVWSDPAATAGLARPTLALGPCAPAQVGMKHDDDVARLGDRSCVRSFEGESLARPVLGAPSAPPRKPGK